MAAVLARMNRVSAGRLLLSRAMESWGLSDFRELLHWIRPGEVSKTDAILTRHLDPASGRENLERQVTIYLKLNQPLDDQVMDLAHELTHAIARPQWDPYDPKLTRARYLKIAIEGVGGEVDAVIQECQVGVELAGQAGTPVSRCDDYRVGKKLSRQKILKDFYRVGHWKPQITAALGQDVQQFPDLSDRSPTLYSSTGGAPYPVALLNEYLSLTQAACENSKTRIRTLAAARSPAGTDVQEKTLQFISRRCAQSLEIHDSTQTSH